jgi:ubiquinone/menaquinone biosynthesis C-methylase UbiE
MTTTISDNPAPATKGHVMRSSARVYDILVWLLTLGRERPFRERLLDLARLQPGESVLDVGCGTGTLAIAAKRRAGPSGAVHGIDASPEMIARATRKAEKAAVDVTFRTAIIETLPFPDNQFDVVFSTMMLHHLPRSTREQGAREIRRVLKTGGRVLAVEFGMPAHHRKGIIGHLHRRGHLSPDSVKDLLSSSRLTGIESGAVGVRDLHFSLATA